MAKSETAWRFLAATLFCAIIIYFSGLTNANAEECANLMSSESRPPDAAYAWLQKISPLIDLVRQEQDADAARKLRPYLSDTAQRELDAFMQNDIPTHTHGRTTYHDFFPGRCYQDTNKCLPVRGHQCWGVYYEVTASPDQFGAGAFHPQSISLIALGGDKFQIVSLFDADGETGN
jgi:hypothetical protein